MFGKKVIPTVLVSLLLLGTSALPTRADQLGESIQQKNDIQSQKDQARGQLNKLTYTSEKMKTQLAQLETQVAAAQTALNQNKVAYVQAQTQVTVAQKELDQKQKELDDRRVALGKRARGIYESGQISHLELLFQSTDLSDFITRMEYFSKLVDNDRQLLEDIESQKAQISKKKSELQAKRDQAAKLEKESALVTADLEKKKSLQSNALEQNQKAQQAAFDEIDRLEAESKALTEKIRKLQATQAGKGSPSGNGTISTWPVPGYYEITSPFGWRTHPITKKRSMHTGTDVGAPTGTKLHAAGAGVVIMAGWNTAYGNMTIIDHGSGISTLYGHQSRLDVSEGQSVEANQVIGAVGSTGWSTGAHLHFEVRVGGNPTDPLQYFPN
ncbi:murein hydrolase activator EnvC family protein [Desulfosporosinus nitroreducens]|uniref:Peptidoglycan DD-metalloendopeptidase family protein n=1 Tax=Desulfosporosinus nitroreducens TaxID=2018668 RepID=A0ABT8QL34_9FIRM|nr:peptidoglycan DD-metalloendopeptidase family protein [Desulfosporosinus nitroreducens]MCO1601557.1 peptidoglycan DD-metalloendopeptidase family protein [Desulfosporosinus nitroreducens]MDO0822052.1 peptidoglycan DD-metalloendopeptidase family protein [Desulfosporosinus nitroreducens]